MLSARSLKYKIMSKFNIYNPYVLSNKDYHLTTFMDSESKYKYSFSKYVILCEFLKDYGIYISMGTHVYNLNKEQTPTPVHACWLDENIPIENIGIIEQMYGYDNSLIQIRLNQNEERWFSFWYNTKDKSCELEKLVWSEVKWSKMYKNFEEMMLDVRCKKSIDELALADA